MVGEDGKLPLPWFNGVLEELQQAPRGHALLLNGVRGVGQFELAQVLAQAWLCETSSRPSLAPCGHCAGCRLLIARSHPDLMVLLPDALRASLGWSLGEEEGDSDAKKKPSREIKVDAVRAAVAFTQRTASRGGAKVVLVHPADALNGIAANTLLKTLEEPPPAVRFVLCAASPDDLLPTIRSRCQPWRLDAPARDLAERWLGDQGVDEPAVLLAAAGGQPLTALEWSQQGINAQAWRKLGTAVRRGDASPVSGWPVPRVIEALLKLAHDSARIRLGASPQFFEPSVLQPPADLGRLSDWTRDLLRVQRQADHPWHAQLLIETLVTKGQQAFH